MKAMPSTKVGQLASLARAASIELFNADRKKRDRALANMARALQSAAAEIEAANQLDLEAASRLMAEGAISQAMLDRLKIDRAKLDGIINGIEQVRALADPLGSFSLSRELDDALELYRVVCPLGVIAVIFESRPDVLPQIASLAIKSGNAVLLKGGSEAANTLMVMTRHLEAAIVESGLPAACLTLLDGREDVEALLKLDSLVDLIIPRGSSSLVRHIMDNTRIPVLGHAEGVCHIYLHEDADVHMAVELVVDAKTQYPSACNAVETLLVNEQALKRLLPPLIKALCQEKVLLRLDEKCYRLAGQSCPQYPVDRANEDDWRTEYCDLILSVRAVATLEQAIEHINQFGSGHTESIVTYEKQVFEKFFNSVNSAGVYWNASTRFADGFRYGFGAEVGISTGKMHPRGPVGLDGLLTYKYKLIGNGHTVAGYSGLAAKKFKHRDL